MDKLQILADKNMHLLTYPSIASIRFRELCLMAPTLFYVMGAVSPIGPSNLFVTSQYGGQRLYKLLKEYVFVVPDFP
jgi:hypothetical protein